jgi:magnesium transporter
MKNIKAYAAFLPEIKQLLQKQELDVLRGVLREINPVDLAEGWKQLDQTEQLTLFQLLPLRKAVVVFEELDGEDQLFLLSRLGEQSAGQMVNELRPSEVAHLFRKLPPRVIRRMHNLVKRREAVETLERALAYPSHTAGALMHTDVVCLKETMTATQALEAVRAFGRTSTLEEGLLSNLYVVNGNGLLRGYVPLSVLVAAPADGRMSELMHPAHSIQIDALADQEEAARIVAKYNLVSAPVVDGAGRLVGVLLVDDVLDILQREASEDIAKMAGTWLGEFTARSALRIAPLRMPWLVFSVLGETLVSVVVRHFEPALVRVVALASFMPLIAAMGGNVGAQSATIVVRSLAIGQLRLSEWRKAFFREAVVGLLLGLVYGVVAGGFAWFLYPHWGWSLALVVGLGMLTSLSVAAMMGATEPFVLQRLGLDPATATGPLITTTNDLIATTVYLTLATFVFLRGG